MKLFIATALALAVCGLQTVESNPVADKVDCSKLEEVLEEYGAAQGMTVLNDKYKIAETLAEYDNRCKESAEAFKVLRKYNKECHTALTQQVFSAILRTRSQFNEPKCVAGTPEYTEGFEAAKCVKDNSFERVKDAEIKTIVGSEVLLNANIPDEKLRMRHACCDVAASKKLFMDAATEKCAKYEKIYSDYADSYTTEAMSLICPEKDKLECDKLTALSYEGAKPKSRFFMAPVLKIVKSLDH